MTVTRDSEAQPAARPVAAMPRTCRSVLLYLNLNDRRGRRPAAATVSDRHTGGTVSDPAVTAR